MIRWLDCAMAHRGCTAGDAEMAVGRLVGQRRAGLRGYAQAESGGGPAESGGGEAGARGGQTFSPPQCEA